MGIQQRISAGEWCEQICIIRTLLWVLHGEEIGGGRPVKAIAVDPTGGQGAWTQKVAIESERIVRTLLWLLHGEEIGGGRVECQKQ